MDGLRTRTSYGFQPRPISVGGARDIPSSRGKRGVTPTKLVRRFALGTLVVTVGLVFLILVVGQTLGQSALQARAARSSNSWDLYLLDIDRSLRFNLTSPLDSHTAEFGSFQCTISQTGQDADSDIQLPHARADNLTLIWSPDGTWFAFVTGEKGNTEVYAVCFSDSALGT